MNPSAVSYFVCMHFHLTLSNAEKFSIMRVFHPSQGCCGFVLLNAVIDFTIKAL